ncbi:MAG: chemotaxis protein CheA [Nitrospirae bacterium YQR-1]
MGLDAASKAFLEEATEILQVTEEQLLSLEELPGDKETINALFRGAHTIKGGAGMIGLTDIERFTHKVESVLERLRNDKIKTDSVLINLLLRSRDYINELLKRTLKDNKPMTEELMKTEQELLDSLSVYLDDIKTVIATGQEAPDTATAQTEPAIWHISLRFNKNLLRDAMDPLSLINYLGKMGEIINMTTITQGIPPLAEMDPEECFTGFELDIKTDKNQNEIAGVFEFYTEDNDIKIVPPHSKVETYISLINSLPEDSWMLGEVLIKSGLLTEEDLNKALRIQSEGAMNPNKGKPRIGEVLVDSGAVEQKVVDVALNKQQKVRESIATTGTVSTASATIRVDADKLDLLINLVGELVVANGGIRQRSLAVGDGPLMKTSSFMTKLVNDIRDMSMKMRMIPIGSSFNRFHRLVRDISKELGKEIELVITGGDTELDKTVIEKISDPLTHIVRNSVDHGIETIEQRIKNGKPPKGTIKLNACYEAGTIVIEITDDGKGLNKQRIVEKAIAAGLIDTNRNLPDKEIFNLIFEPGFSTAESVSKLSGRGVGMDVVKRNIEALRGSVYIESEEGKGTAIRINLPLTLSIIDGFMVGVGGKQYVIPLDMVVKCYTVDGKNYSMLKKKGYFDFQGKVIPFISMCEMFGLDDSKCSFIVIVTHGGLKAAIGVDELFGDMQAVIKSLGKLYKDAKGFSGATILGDGSVALILDIQGIFKLLESEARV